MVDQKCSKFKILLTYKYMLADLKSILQFVPYNEMESYLFGIYLLYKLVNYLIQI